MEVKIGDLTVNAIWLRDNCRCNECYNRETHQRNSNDIEISNVEIQNYSIRGDHVKITWADHHSSDYTLNWIKDQHRLEMSPQQVLWAGNQVSDMLPVITDDHTETTILQLVKSVLQFGVAIVQNIPTSMNSTEQLVRRMAPVMHTLYGEMWYLDNTDSTLDEYRDTAYTTQELAVHTDNTYFVEPAGLQVFHCLEPAAQGGETILVDGFNAAQLLREQNDEHYRCLRSSHVEWQYISDKFHITFTSPIVNTYLDTDNMKQIRYNIYDRSPRIFGTPRQQSTFYTSLKHFRTILHGEQMQWKLHLQPGSVLFINNWRVLHGRKAFRGRRRIVGCYVAMNAFLSAARKLRLIL